MDNSAASGETLRKLPFSVPISTLHGQQGPRGRAPAPVPRIMQNAARSMQQPQQPQPAQPQQLQHNQADQDAAPSKQQASAMHQAVPMPPWADMVAFMPPPQGRAGAIPGLPCYQPWCWQASTAGPGMVPTWMQPAPPAQLVGQVPEMPGAPGASSHNAPPLPTASAVQAPAPAGGTPPAGGQAKRRGRASRGRKEPGREAASSPEALVRGGALLQEVRRQGESCSLALKDLLPQIADLARDAAGSKFVLLQLEGANAEDRAQAFERLLPEVATLAAESWGHTVVQKMLDVGTPEQRKAVAQQLQGEVLRLSNKMYGCRVIQKAFQACAPEVQLLLASELKKGVIECIKSMHGNYVIQMCIEQMPPDSVSFVVEAIEDRAEQTAAHIYGCRIIQRLLEHCSPSRLESMLKRILGSVLRLAEDAYGNYVIRHILDHGRKEHKQRIIEAVRGNVTQLSLDKCASNVVEKCIEASTVGEHAHALAPERERLLRSILGEADDQNPPIHRLVDDRFGKYVVQCVIDNSRREEKLLIRERLAAAGPRTRKTTLHCAAHLATLNRQMQG